MKRVINKYVLLLLTSLMLHYSYGYDSAIERDSLKKINSNHYSIWVSDSLPNDKFTFNKIYSRCDKGVFYPAVCSAKIDENTYALNKIRTLYKLDLITNQICELQSIYYAGNNILLSAKQKQCYYERIIPYTLGDDIMSYVKNNN